LKHYLSSIAFSLPNHSSWSQKLSMFRIHTSFNQIGTATGRITTVNPNLQTIPKEFSVSLPPRKPLYLELQTPSCLHLDCFSEDFQDSERQIIVSNPPHGFEYAFLLQSLDAQSSKVHVYSSGLRRILQNTEIFRVKAFDLSCSPEKNTYPWHSVVHINARKAFIPSKDFLIVSADFRQIECRMVWKCFGADLTRISVGSHFSRSQVDWVVSQAWRFLSNGCINLAGH